jgi:hypothetical protein
MSGMKSFPADNLTAFEFSADGEDKLVLIDDAGFVSAFAEAGMAVGKKLVCVRCFDPGRALRAVVVLLDAWNAEDESAGSVGFCCDCYRDLAELLFHDAVLRATKSVAR